MVLYPRLRKLERSHDEEARDPARHRHHRHQPPRWHFLRGDSRRRGHSHTHVAVSGDNRVPNARGCGPRLMNGTSAFMSSIANITPSGSPPHTRITTTRSPMLAPKSHRPALLTGAVAISVAMNTAPSIRPPENSMNGAEA